MNNKRGNSYRGEALADDEWDAAACADLIQEDVGLQRPAAHDFLGSVALGDALVGEDVNDIAWEEEDSVVIEKLEKEGEKRK